MIHVSFALRWPWSRRFDSGHVWHGKITRHKSWEIQLMKTNTIVECDLAYTTQQDHGGLRLEFGVLGYTMCFHFYDRRHWNHNTNQWENL